MPEMSYQKLYDLTLAIKQLMDSENDEVQGEKIIQLTELLRERSELMKSLPKASHPSDRILCQKVIDLNRDIDSELKRTESAIIKNMNAFRQRKKSVGRYRNPYQGPTRDGMFLDKRK